MFKRLYRQRRRLMFLATMIALSLWISSIGNHEMAYMLKHEFGGRDGLFFLSIGLAVVLITLAAGVWFLWIFPSARRLSEATGIAAVASEAVMHADAVLPAWALSGMMPWVWFGAFAYLTLIILERDIPGRLGLKMRYRVTRTRTIAASSDAIWAAIAPDESCLGTHWAKAIAAITPRPDLGENVVDVRYHMGPPLSFTQTQTRRIWQRPFHLAYDFEPADDLVAAHGISGSFEMLCDGQEDGRTKLTLTRDYPAIGFATWAMIWLDDMAGCEMDSLQARLTGRRDWSIAGWSARKMVGA